MTGICCRCGRCCMYVPYENRKNPNSEVLRCPHLVGVVGKLTQCLIYDQPNRLGREIDYHIFCGLRDSNKHIDGCTYFNKEIARKLTTNLSGGDIIGKTISCNRF